MIDIKLIKDEKKLLSCDAHIVLLSRQECKKKLTGPVKTILEELWGDYAQIFDAQKFVGCRKEQFMHLGFGEKSKGVVPVAVSGLGSLSRMPEENRDVLRRALTGALNKIRATGAKKIGLVLPDHKKFKVSRAELVKQAAILLHMAHYRFNDFKKIGDTKKKEWKPVISLLSSSSDDADALKTGVIIGKATNHTRRMADTPPNHMTPTILSGHAAEVAKAHGLKYTVFGEDEARDMGMGCYYSVTKGSSEEGKFVTLEYKTSTKNAPTIALVGKGVCFDTGGISLKPDASMGGMKYDMSGAAAVIGAMEAIAQIKPNVNVVGVTPMVENMPDGTASKRDDVVVAMNGKSVEIISTDAEGRMILADALCYTEKNFKPDLIVDIATLTGACSYFLGHFFSGLFTKDAKLAKKLTEAGSLAGDRLWQLPLDDEYLPAVESSVADVMQCGNRAYKAGATTAALFLSNFVEKTPWAHLDIAGTADGVPGVNYYGKGATGVGVRLFVELVCSYKK